MAHLTHPYQDSPARSFWRSGVVEADRCNWPEIYTPKVRITRDTSVATAGSCFAKHIGRSLRLAGGNVLDAEPKPEGMSAALARRFGYGVYSARYGDIHTARQMRELLEDAQSLHVDERLFRCHAGKWFDALRPDVEPEGCATLQEAVELRREHLVQVAALAQVADVFVFTLGASEVWMDRESGRTLAHGPDVVAGSYDPARTVFYNFTYDEIHADLLQILRLLRGMNKDARLLLTVSPMPLGATASGQHVLAANSHSKALLRAAAGAMADKYKAVDYFPAFEIVTTWAAPEAAYAPDLRSVRPEMVETVMRVFLTAHGLAVEAGPVGEGEGVER